MPRVDNISLVDNTPLVDNMPLVDNIPLVDTGGSIVHIHAVTDGHSKGLSHIGEVLRVNNSSLILYCANYKYHTTMY